MASGSPDMKHVAFKDEKLNYFVLKRSKKDSSVASSSTDNQMEVPDSQL